MKKYCRSSRIFPPRSHETMNECFDLFKEMNLQKSNRLLLAVYLGNARKIIDSIVFRFLEIVSTFQHLFQLQLP